MGRKSTASSFTFSPEPCHHKSDVANCMDEGRCNHPNNEEQQPDYFQNFPKQMFHTSSLTALRLAHCVSDFYASFRVSCPPLIGNRAIRLLLHLPHYIVRVAQ